MTRSLVILAVLAALGWLGYSLFLADGGTKAKGSGKGRQPASTNAGRSRADANVQSAGPSAGPVGGVVLGPDAPLENSLAS